MPLEMWHGRRQSCSFHPYALHCKPPDFRARLRKPNKFRGISAINVANHLKAKGRTIMTIAIATDDPTHEQNGISALASDGFSFVSNDTGIVSEIQHGFVAVGQH